MEGLHDVHAQAVDGVLHGVEAVAQALGHAVQLPDDGLGVQTALKDGFRGIAATHAAKPAKPAEAAHAAPAEHTKDEEQDNPSPPIAAPATATVAVGGAGRCHIHDGRNSAIFSAKRHIQFSFVDVFLLRGHAL